MSREKPAHIPYTIPPPTFNQKKDNCHFGHQREIGSVLEWTEINPEEGNVTPAQ